MIRQGGGGKIIGAASIAAHKGFAMLGHYSASKSCFTALSNAVTKTFPAAILSPAKTSRQLLLAES